MTPFQILRMSAGKAARQVNIFDAGPAHTNTPGSASYNLFSSGVGAYSLAAGGSTQWTWLLSGLNTDYQVRATLNSGNTLTGTLNSWLSLGSDRTWTLSVGGTGGAKESVLTIEIRRVSDNVTIATAIIDIIVG